MRHIVCLYFFISFQLLNAEVLYYNENKKDIYLKKYTGKEVFKSSNVDHYINEKDMVVGVTDKLIVKFLNITNVEKYLEEFHLKIEKKLSNNMYLFITRDKNETVEISRNLSEKTDVQYAHPDFIKKIKTR